MSGIDVCGLFKAEPISTHFDKGDDAHYPVFGLRAEGGSPLPGDAMIALLRKEYLNEIQELLRQYAYLFVETDEEDVLDSDLPTARLMQISRLEIGHRDTTRCIHADIDYGGKSATRGIICAKKGIKREDPTVIIGRRRMAELLVQYLSPELTNQQPISKWLDGLREYIGADKLYTSALERSNAGKLISAICDESQKLLSDDQKERILGCIERGMSHAHARIDWTLSRHVRILMFDNEYAMHKRGEITQGIF